MNQTAYAMLEAVAKHSTNQSCSEPAKEFLEDKLSISELAAKSGGFMTAVIKGDFVAAWRRADGANRRALTEMLVEIGVAGTLSHRN